MADYLKNSKTSGKRGDIKKQGYVEVYIEDDGRLRFIPLTRNTAPLIRGFLEGLEKPPSIYCG